MMRYYNRGGMFHGGVRGGDDRLYDSLDRRGRELLHDVHDTARDARVAEDRGHFARARRLRHDTSYDDHRLMDRLSPAMRREYHDINQEAERLRHDRDRRMHYRNDGGMMHHYNRGGVTGNPMEDMPYEGRGMAGAHNRPVMLPENPEMHRDYMMGVQHRNAGGMMDGLDMAGAVPPGWRRDSGMGSGEYDGAMHMMPDGRWMEGAEHDPRRYNDGGDIHIKKSREGLFTKKAQAAGMGVQEFARKVMSAPEGQYSPETRRQANFARNAAKWN